MSQNVDLFYYCFLDEIFSKSVNVKDCFPDAGTFIKSVTTLQRVVGFDLLDGNKCYRLRKRLTGLRKVFRVNAKENETFQIKVP